MRSCIFCGRKPVTKEDAWPVWLIEQVGRPQHLIATTSGPGARPAYRTDRIEQRAGCACKACNNGWMSDLEKMTKPILGPMVDGEPRQLSGIEQAVLAAWMLKTLMVFEWVLGGNQYWRRDERELMFRRQVGPALKDCMTCAAGYEGLYTALAFPRRQAVRLLSGEDTGVPVFSGVLAVGKALMWLQADRYKEMTEREGWLLPPKHFDRFVLLGGPASAAIDWPKSKVFDDDALREFLDTDAGS